MDKKSLQNNLTYIEYLAALYISDQSGIYVCEGIQGKYFI